MAVAAAAGIHTSTTYSAAYLAWRETNPTGLCNALLLNSSKPHPNNHFS